MLFCLPSPATAHFEVLLSYSAMQPSNFTLTLAINAAAHPVRMLQNTEKITFITDQDGCIASDCAPHLYVRALASGIRHDGRTDYRVQYTLTLQRVYGGIPWIVGRLLGTITALRFLQQL